MGLVLSNFNVLIITCHILMPIKDQLWFTSINTQSEIDERVSKGLRDLAILATGPNNTFNSNFKF